MAPADIKKRLKNLEVQVIQQVAAWQSQLELVEPRYFLSARNLLRYIALRQNDLRKLQIELGSFGLTLSQSERHVLRNLREVIARIEPADHETAIDEDETLSWTDAKHLLHRHSRAVFGLPTSLASASEPHQAIMVTASYPMTYETCAKVQEAGATILRINSAHNLPEQWLDVIKTWRQVSTERSLTTRVMIDVAGPKLRTGRARMPKPFLKFRPERNFDGGLLRPYCVTVEQGAECQVGSDLWLIPNLDTLDCPSFITITDSRGRRRRFIIRGDKERLYFEGDRTCYINPGCTLELQGVTDECLSTTVAKIIGADDIVFLKTDDQLRMSDPQIFDSHALDVPMVECLEQGLFSILQTGQILSFDDGSIECVVDTVGQGYVDLTVVQTTKPLARLRSDKGINVPGARLPLPLLAEDDFVALDFALQHADIVSFSFIRDADDIATIKEVLQARSGPRDFPVVLKIETAEAAQNLGAILLSAMQHYPISLMIARGDLAVEVGYMPSGEVQEDLLLLAEAAHIPVVLATEVLGQMLKSGSPSRAEVTDAAMSVRAECVMLNKGPYLVEAVRALQEILLKMQLHRYKNLEIYRPTTWSHSLP